MKFQPRTFTTNTLLKTQFDILFANSWWLIIGQFLISTAMLGWLWNQLDHLLLMLWYGCTFIPPLFRAYLTSQYNRQQQKNLRFLKISYLGGSVVYGFIWGALVFINLTPLSFYFVLFVLAGLMVVTIGSSSTYLPAVISFIFPLGFCASTKALYLAISYPAEGWFTTFLFIFLAFVVMLISTRSLNRSIVAGLQLRFENSELVKSLLEQKAQVEIAKEIAEKANKDKSRFLAAASHDLRQPLHAMSLLLDAIRYCDEKQQRLGLYEKLEQSVHSLGELFNALLDISKIDANTIDVQPTAFYVSDIFEKVVHEFELEAKHKQLNLSFRSSNIVVNTDPLWLERVLRNLVSNAIRYTDQGKILLACRRSGGNCLIQVWDSGKGIEKSKQELIFQEFVQLHNPERNRNKGLGLGLAIVKRLCDLLNYQIKLRSVENKGSVFSLTLPISNLKVTKQQENTLLPSQTQLLDKHILIIEDDEDVLTAMTVMLEKWGCQVIAANSALTAIEALDSSDNFPALIISDFRLAKHRTGLEAISAINQRYQKTIPAILITGETEKAIIEEISQSHYKVLHKPIKPAKLRVLMNHMLNH
ncbi:ATP-binding response regulator [Thalassotalea sp. PLHSN55]|uniref:ATP-binding response regulator n=1 Tax=Thalassotalea sp. PLHSN55 TaxID=3435888 RepID=UPI003F843C8D